MGATSQVSRGHLRGRLSAPWCGYLARRYASIAGFGTLTGHSIRRGEGKLEVVVVRLRSCPVRRTLLWSDPRGRRQQNPRRAAMLPIRAAILASATPPCSVVGPAPRRPASARAASWPAHAAALPGSAGRRFGQRALPPASASHCFSLRAPPPEFVGRRSVLCAAPAASHTGHREVGREVKIGLIASKDRYIRKIPLKFCRSVK